MIYLKKINLDDIDKEYEAIIKIPKNENRFENIDKKVSFDRMMLFLMRKTSMQCQ